MLQGPDLVDPFALAGDAEEDVMAVLVGRYGEVILLKPRLSAETALLWAEAVVVLVAGGVAALRVLRKGKAGPVASGYLSDEETAALDRILSEK